MSRHKTLFHTQPFDCDIENCHLVLPQVATRAYLFSSLLFRKRKWNMNFSQLQLFGGEASGQSYETSNAQSDAGNFEMSRPTLTIATVATVSVM